ncbi:MAG: hypothetical protein WC460_05230 [Patescibacteria group bacterium]
MDGNQGLIAVLMKLSEKIKNREISCRQLQKAIDQRLIVVKDQPQTHDDPDVNKALAEVASEFAESWDINHVKIGMDILWEFGYGVATGTFGQEFLRNFIDQCEKEEK